MNPWNDASMIARSHVILAPVDGAKGHPKEPARKPRDKPKGTKHLTRSACVGISYKQKWEARAKHLTTVQQIFERNCEALANNLNYVCLRVV